MRGSSSGFEFLRWAIAAAACCAGAVAHAGAGPTIVRVGTVGGCDFATLQPALDFASNNAASTTEIRISSLTIGQTLVAQGRNLVLDGRYANCDSTVPDDGLRQTLTGNAPGPVMRISNGDGADPRQVILRNVIVRGGSNLPQGGFASPGVGGGLVITGPLDVRLLDSRVSDNEATLGGGIAINGISAQLTLDEGTIIGSEPGQGLVGNRALSGGNNIGLGGGIHCVLGTVLINDARIRVNSSPTDGGGVYLNDCTLGIAPRPAFANAGFVTLFGNTAGGNGGGVFATGGSGVFWRAPAIASFGGRATGNSAAGRGGAVFLSGQSEFVGDWLRFEDNRADGRGGAIAVQGGSRLALLGGPDFDCDGDDCPGIFGTRGITEGEQASLLGGALYAEGGSSVDLRQQRIFDNRASVGSAILLSGSTTSADLRSVLIARNVLYGVGNATSTVDLISSASIQMRYVTMAGNFRVSNAFPLIEPALSSIRANGNSATVELRNSSVWNDGVQVFRSLAGATATGSCVLAHENASFAPATIANPLYVDTTGDDPDYSLRRESPAIDRCAASGTNEADVRGVARPQDTPAPNLAGPFDAGAFEFLLVDPVFRNDFEGLTCSPQPVC